MVRGASGGAEPEVVATGLPADRSGPQFLGALVEALPAAAFVIDADGYIRFATSAAADLVGGGPGALVGRSVLEFVDEDTAWAYAAAVAMAGDYPDVVTGPMRITIVGREGQTRAADLWAANHLDDPDVGGIVCLLTPETTAVGLAEAVNLVSNDGDFASVAGRVVRAMSGHPTVGEAALVSVGPSGFRRVAASSDALPDEVAGGPWDVVQQTGVRQMLDTLADWPTEGAWSEALAQARSAGFETVWVEPVGAVGEPVRGALVVWRDHPGRPTPNELNAVHQAAAIVALAWERHESRA
jgi:hypothetical protein